jgi:hypothetical protein
MTVRVCTICVIMWLEVQQLGYHELFSHPVGMDSSSSTPSLNRDEKFPGARPPERQHFVEWHLTFVGSQYGKCFLSPFWKQHL